MRAMNAIFGAAVVLATGVSVLAQSAENSSVKSAPHAYHVTYTLTQMDGSKRVGVQHFTMSVTADNENANLTLGSRVPIQEGTGDSYTYLSIGLDITARLREFSNGLELYSNVDQSSFGSVSNLTNPSEAFAHAHPVLRHSQLKNTTLLSLGKQALLGSLDQPGSTEHLDVDVSIEPIR